MSNSTKAKKLAQAASEFRSYDDEGNECWEVESILDRKYSRAAKDFLYLVKWKGWRIEDSTWEPVDNLLGSFPMLEEFEKNYQEFVLPLEPAYTIIGPESHPITIDDLKKSKSSSGKSKPSPLSKTKKDTPLNSDRKQKKEVEQKPKKDKSITNTPNKTQKHKKKSSAHVNETSEGLTTDSSSHKSERPKELVLNESFAIEVKTETFDKRQSQAQMEYVENPDIRIPLFQFSQETTCKQEPSDYESRAMRPITVRQDDLGLKNDEMTHNILGESLMKEKDVSNGSQPSENQDALKSPVGMPALEHLTISMTEEINCLMEVEPSVGNITQTQSTNMEHCEGSTPISPSAVTEQVADVVHPITQTETVLVKEPTSNILVGGLVANFSKSKSLTMPDQVCFGRSELVPHFEQPKPKITKSSGLGMGCGFFTEKTKGLSRKETSSDDVEFIDFYSPPSKFQKSGWGENYHKSYGVRLNGKLGEPNRARHKKDNRAVPDVGFDWKDIMHWANNNRIVVGAVSEMKNKIRKAMEADARKALKKCENGSERSVSKKRTKRSKLRSRGTRTEEKSDGKKISVTNRELIRDQERDKRENSVVSDQAEGVRRISRRFRNDDCSSELQLDDILSARRKKKNMRRNGDGETQSLNLDPEEDDFAGIKLQFELNFGFEDEQRAFESAGDLDDSNSSDSDSDSSESSGWGLGTTIFVENNFETEV